MTFSFIEQVLNLLLLKISEVWAADIDADPPSRKERGPYRPDYTSTSLEIPLAASALAPAS
jgi:hypothetical protein